MTDFFTIRHDTIHEKTFFSTEKVNISGLFYYNKGIFD